VVGILAAVGTATAADLITSADIKNGTVTSIDIKNGTIKVKDISKKARTALKGNVGPQGPTGPTGATGGQGPQGPAGADGTARAYGLVNNASATPVMQKSKGGPTVRRSGNGIFCITVSGIDPASNVIVPQIDASGSLAGLVTVVSGFGAVFSQQCTGTEFQVVTYDANNGAGRNDVSFNFVIP
jgi:hypothetical protein